MWLMFLTSNFPRETEIFLIAGRGSLKLDFTYNRQIRTSGITIAMNGYLIIN